MISVIEKAALALGGSLAVSIAVKATAIVAMALIGVGLARKSRAALRHALLAAAFVALLALPMASILAPPIHISVPVAAQGENAAPPAPSYSTPASPAAGKPTLRTAGAVETSRWPSISVSDFVLALWILGAACFLLPVVIGLWQIRSLRRTALPWRRGQLLAAEIAAEIGIRRRVDVLLHEDVAGPMTCGVLRPAILLSCDVKAWSDEGLGRAIAHELEHVRRADWLTHCAARIACAFYWFHPLVWTMWRKLTLEAERSCDDAVIKRSEATAYAEQLVALARRLSTAERSPLLAMASRSDLASRVTAVLDSRQRRGRAGVSAVVLASACAMLMLAALSPLEIAAQATTDWEKAAGGKMSFDVASVKEVDVDTNVTMRRVGSTGPVNTNTFPLDSSDRYSGDTTLFSGTFHPITYLSFAYKLSAIQVQALESQLPKWATAKFFDIEARAASPATKDQMRLMVQSLLADRFKLAVHFETKQGPIFNLVLINPGKTGPQLHHYADDPPCTAPPQYRLLTVGNFPSTCYSLMTLGFVGKGATQITFGARNVTMQQIGNDLVAAPTADLNRPIVDQTGLTGQFDFVMNFIQPVSASSETAQPSDSDGVTFLEALKDQLGLKLQSGSGPVESLIVDHIEEPTPN